jgi:hypothetical protein
MYSSRAASLIHRHPLWNWPVGRQLLCRSVLGLMPEGLGLTLSGFALLLGLSRAALFVFVAANLIALGLLIGRPRAAEPGWMRTRAPDKP